MKPYTREKETAQVVSLSRSKELRVNLTYAPSILFFRGFMRNAFLTLSTVLYSIKNETAPIGCRGCLTEGVREDLRGNQCIPTILSLGFLRNIFARKFHV